LATADQGLALRQKYLAGNFGYGHAKQELYELILQKFAKEREAFNYFMNNIPELEKILSKCENRATEIATAMMLKVRKKLGFG
jgi:tryptophanyl-tRNA synthetase